MKKILFAVCAMMFLTSYHAVAQTVEKLDSIVSESSKEIYTWGDDGLSLKRVALEKSDNGWQEKEVHFYDNSVDWYYTYSNGVISFGQKTEYTYEDGVNVASTYYSWANGNWQKDTYVYDKTIGDTLHIYRQINYTDGEVSGSYGYNETCRLVDGVEYWDYTANFEYINGEWCPVEYAKRKADEQETNYKSECTYDSLGRKDEERFYRLSSDNQWKLSERDKYVYTDMPMDSVYAVYHYQTWYYQEPEEVLDNIYYYVYSAEKPFASVDLTNSPYQQFTQSFYPDKNSRETYTFYAIGDGKLAVGSYDYRYGTYFDDIQIHKLNKQACNHESGGELVTTFYKHTVTTRDTLSTAKLWKYYLGPKILNVVSLDEQGNEISRSDYYYSEVTSTAIPDLSQQTISPSVCYDLTGRRISDPSSYHGLILKNINGKIRKVYQ